MFTLRVAVAAQGHPEDVLESGHLVKGVPSPSMHACVLFSSYHLAVYESMLIIYLLTRLLSVCLFENINYLNTGSGSTLLDLIPLMPRMLWHRVGTLFLPTWLTDEELKDLGLGLCHLG